MIKFENLDLFTNGEFATVALVNDSIEISGIFDEHYQTMFDDTQLAEGRRYSFLVQTAVADIMKHRDRLSIKNKNFEIVSIQPIEDGKLTNLILKLL